MSGSNDNNTESNVRDGEAESNVNESNIESNVKGGENTNSAPIVIVYNKKWNGYLGIMLSSLVNFTSIAQISVDDISNISLRGENVMAIFGAVSFIITLLILAFDRIHVLQKKVDFKEVFDGKLEGIVLLSLVIWWVVGVGLMTRAGGIAYGVLNTYFSCWYTLGLSVWTLNQWSEAKDIISIHELVRLSETLPFWYILLIASVVEMGSAADAFNHYDSTLKNHAKKGYSVAVGAVSTVIAIIAILAHYKLICCCKTIPGGTTEITVGIVLAVWWILAVSVLTTDESIASTIQGVHSCNGNASFPGSNLYLSLWLGLFASLRVCLRWKAAQAMGYMHTVTVQRIDRIEKGKQKSNIDDDE
mmetsp:Transcript_22260/g.25774  ORF Transcript_22260/g.25774 Transcript_22260/m.25774 type:complete len:360 (-) Transcript_22260:127-1206(-)